MSDSWTSYSAKAYLVTVNLYTDLFFWLKNIVTSYTFAFWYSFPLGPVAAFLWTPFWNVYNNTFSWFGYWGESWGLAYLQTAHAVSNQYWLSWPIVFCVEFFGFIPSALYQTVTFPVQIGYLIWNYIQPYLFSRYVWAGIMGTTWNWWCLSCFQ